MFIKSDGCSYFAWSQKKRIENIPEAELVVWNLYWSSDLKVEASKEDIVQFNIQNDTGTIPMKDIIQCIT